MDASAETKHTPGPWYVGGKDGTIIFPYDGYAIADAKTYHGKHHDGAAQANARLIAAAPELYETAAQAVGYLERICGLVPGEELDLQDVRDLLVDRRSFFRAAIAKAEGR